MITDAQLESALSYLSETDEEAAELKASVERQEYKLKRMKATVFKMSAGTVAERQAEAEIHETVQGAQDDHVEAIKAFNTVANRRDTQILIVEVWRSVNSARKKGLM